MTSGNSSRRAKSRSGRRRRQVAGTEVLTESAWKTIGRSLKLSGRELQIVRGVFEDRTEFAIAANLSISPHTVHTHVERLHRKLGVANRVQLVLHVMNEFHQLTASPRGGLPPLCANWQAGRCPLRRINR